MKILVLNSGSSSQKSSLYELGDLPPVDPPPALWQGSIEWGPGTAKAKIRTAGGFQQEANVQVRSRREAIKYLLTTLWHGEGRELASPSEIDVVGHRVVHGGPNYETPVLISPDVKKSIEQVSVFAPLHNRAELEGMNIVEQLLGPVPQVAVFDTGFHARMPVAAATYGGPYEWLERGIRRYGFHGINHEYCAERSAKLLGKNLARLRIVSCHLGNGCSLAAIRGGNSIDTTMGFTPLDGLVMGTRSGSVDPGILTFLMRNDYVNGEELDSLLNRKSGLLGMSGVSSDMRDILSAKREGNHRAKLAFDVYIHRLRSSIGSMVAALGGLDVLVFTAGVGENSAEVREAACSGFEFLGLRIDPGKNSQPARDQDIAAEGSAVRVLVVRAQEDWAIARACWSLAKDLASPAEQKAS